MTLRVDNSRASDLPPPSFEPLPHASSEPPAPLDPDAHTLADNLRRFVDAAREGQRAGRLAAVGGAVAGGGDIDAQRSARIRAFFDRLDVEVPVLAGEPGEARRVAVPFRMSHESDNSYYNRALLEALGSCAFAVRRGSRHRWTRDARADHRRWSSDLAARHPEEFAPQRAAEQVRNYLRSLGVGIDCAGSVQLALFDSHGLSPESGKAHFGLRTRLNEDLT